MHIILIRVGKLFEAVNLSDTVLVEDHIDYYNLSLEFFNIQQFKL